VLTTTYVSVDLTYGEFGLSPMIILCGTVPARDVWSLWLLAKRWTNLALVVRGSTFPRSGYRACVSCYTVSYSI